MFDTALAQLVKSQFAVKDIDAYKNSKKLKEIKWKWLLSTVRAKRAALVLLANVSRFCGMDENEKEAGKLSQPL